MADFGTVAAAIQLAETAYKLKKLCSEIRDAPADLLHLVEEVTLLSDLLSEIERPTAHTTLGDQRSWQRCHDLLIDSTNSLRQMTADLEDKLNAHRFTGPIRIYAKKDELLKAKSRLESVKSTMLLAQQAYSFNILTRQNEMLLQRIESVVGQNPSDFSAVQGSSLVSPGDTKSTLRSSRAVDRVASRKKYRQTSKIDLRLPEWIFRRGVQVLVERGSSSWGMSFRIYNHLPPDSELLWLVYQGDWTGVVDLFRSGKASPFDVGPWGDTLLHIAAECADLQGCQLLLDYGLDPSLIVDHFRRTPLQMLAEAMHGWGRHLLRRDPHVNDAVALMVAADPEVYLDCDVEQIMQLMRGFDRKGLSIIIETKIPNYERLSPLLRAQMAVKLCSEDLEALSVILGPNLTLAQAFDLLAAADTGTENHFNLLEFASRMLAASHHQKPTQISMGRERPLAQWTSVISEIIRFESSNHNTLMFTSPLHAYIHEYLDSTFLAAQVSPYTISSWNHHFTQITRKWVETLLNLGADLKRYGRAEKRYLEANRRSMLFMAPCRKGRDLICFELRYLLYGPDVSDWQAFVVPVAWWDHTWDGPRDDLRSVTHHDEYEMAEEFWNSIESPEIFGVPGAYISDEEYHEMRHVEQHLIEFVESQSPVL